MPYQEGAMGHVEWTEERRGELYFVDGDKTPTGWVFFERSTYEVRWFAVKPRLDWIERAEALCRRTENHGGDAHARTSEFKSNVIEAAVMVTAVLWTVGLLAHEIRNLTGLPISPVLANVLAGCALGFALLFVSRRR